MSSEFSDNEQLMLSRLRQDFFFQLYNVMVVSSGETLIRRDHDRSDLSFFCRDLFSLIEITVMQFRHMTENTADLTLKCIEIRLCICQLFPCLRQL